MGVRALDERLRFRETRDGGISHLAVTGDLDAGAESQLTSALAAVLDGPVGLLTVDVSGVPFISASALLDIAAAAEVVPLQLTGANRSVCRVAAILGLTHLIAIDIGTISAA